MRIYNYFSSVFTEENPSLLSALQNNLRSSSSTELLKTIAIDETQVYEVLCKIDPSKGCGPDNIPGRLLKEGALALFEPLSRLFNLSLKTGVLPKDWTRAHVTPVFKKGSKHIPSNYRPISLTCLVVKVMERCVHKNITAFLNDYDKLKTTQHGFRLNHSCQTKFLETLYQWAGSVDNRKSTDAIFLDFSKAFDSVPHQRLLMKLNHIGIRGPLLQWIESFLSGREQRVVIEDHSSKWSHVTSGVPQGSILGPLLFLIYINDIGDNLTSPTRLFADDCVLYREITNPSDHITLQQDLDLVLRWSQLCH